MNTRNERGQFQLTFNEEGEQFDVNQLVDFLQYLKGTYAYVLADRNFQRTIGNVDVSEASFLVEKYTDLIDPSKSQLTKNYKRELGEQELQVLTITKQSPLTILFIGVTAALSAAVIFSGGKFEGKIGPVSVSYSIKSLGKGLQQIEKYLSDRQERKQEIKEHIAYVQRRIPSEFTDADIEVLKKVRDMDNLDEETRQQIDKEIEKRNRNKGRGGELTL